MKPNDSIPVKEVITAKEAPKAIGPYSVGIRVFPWVFCSGQAGIDPKTSELVQGGIEAETRQTLQNIKSVLEAGGSSLSQVVNSSLWDERTGFLYDRRSDGQLSQVKTIGAFWALLAGVLPLDRLEQIIAHLQNSAEFNRPHRVPSLSADHPEYHPQGLYWRGGVWPPTNYMILRGLTQAGHNTLAHEIGLNHHTNVVKVYEDTGTLWEDYAPESIEQGNIARPDFVGWTGLPPVAVLFEYLFGLRPNVPEHKLVWDVRLLEAHGVQQYPFGKQGLLDLYCQPRTDPHQKPVITVKSSLPVKIELIWEDSREIQEFF